MSSDVHDPAEPGNETGPDPKARTSPTVDAIDESPPDDHISDEHTASAEIGTLADILDALGFTDDEPVNIFCKDADGNRSAQSHTRAAAATAELPSDCNVYFRLNPSDIPPGTMGRRGTDENTTRVAGLPIDLDVKDGCCPDLKTAHAVIDDVSAALGMRPVFVIHSGGGLQPVWAVGDCTPDKGRPLLRRWGRWVSYVAGKRHIKLDSVFDTARILRAPGTLNHKYDPPKWTSVALDTGAPMAVAEIDERLTEFNVPEVEEDSRVRGEVIASEASWEWAGKTCGYAITTTRAWLDEPVTARHPWALCCYVRLECMRRNGCLTENEYRDRSARLGSRFVTLLATQEKRRQLDKMELEDIRRAAVELAEEKTEADLKLELGKVDGLGHRHPPRAQPPRSRATIAAADESAASPTTPAAPGLADIALTDTGNAKLLVARHGDHLRYIPRRKVWMCWTGERWEVEDAKDCTELGTAATEVAMSLTVSSGDKDAARHKRHSLSGNGITAMMSSRRMSGTSGHRTRCWTPGPTS
jgi:hypothetical protein